MQLVRQAIDDRTEDLKDAAKDRGKEYDEYWCVFDVDEHPKLLDAIALAAANGIKVALSSPCLELWFLIHFVDQFGHIERDAAQRRAYEQLGCRRKCLTPPALEMLDQGYNDAIRRARSLVSKHSGDGTDLPWNPVSNVWQLTEAIRTATSVEGSGLPFEAS